jgi:hypothetical protein
LVGSIAPPLEPSSGPLFYQPDLLLFKCAKEILRYQKVKDNFATG